VARELAPRRRRPRDLRETRIRARRWCVFSISQSQGRRTWSSQKVYADFHNADAHGRLRLNCVGTLEDLSRQRIELHEGLLLTLYADDLDDKGRLDELLADGVVGYSEDEHGWVATIDWSAIRHASDDRELLDQRR